MWGERERERLVSGPGKHTLVMKKVLGVLLHVFLPPSSVLGNC